MKIMTCPINGPRPVSEFIYQGEFKHMPDPELASDEQWANYVFNKSGSAAVKHEWWYHSPSGVWFIAQRDTATDNILSTFLYADWGKQS